MSPQHRVALGAPRTDEDHGDVLEQPYLHDLVTAVHAPALVLSAADGQVRNGVQGLFVADRRALSRLVIRVDGREPEGIGTTVVAAGEVRFTAVVRNLGDDDADPTVTLERRRLVSADGLVESITMASHAREPVTATVEIELGCDLAAMAAVKSGHSSLPQPASHVTHGLSWDGGAVTTLCDRAVTVDGDVLRWQVDLDRGASSSLELTVQVAPRPGASVLPASVRPAALSSVTARSDDHRFAALLAQSLRDLDGLLLADPLEPSDTFLAAGAPWFLTLFGRDSIWAARMLLPLGTELAAGTLRTLARRQGTVVDQETAQEPGKIMHEIRSGTTDHGTMRLPPLYYGTIDATALWVSLLHDAWRWGLPREQVASLLPHLVRAMEWITGHEGFVSYRDASGHGLANQGWKDSGDSVQFRDGTLATAPIALCEVQGYCVAAARQAADLADAFGLSEGDGWRVWADRLTSRFRETFWVEDDAGRYPAIALDATGRRVDTVTSNIAHLLGTGLLDAREEIAVVERLRRPDMDSGFGMRTMSTTAAGYNPLAYHGGSVWTHDTAIAIAGLAASSAAAASGVAASYLQGLLAAAPTFDFRLPELFGGHPRAGYTTPLPYPASCRPQAWAATASVAMLAATLGLRPDAPENGLTLRPLRPSPIGALEVSGLRLGEHEFSVRLDAHGDPGVSGLDRSVRVVVE